MSEICWHPTATVKIRREKNMKKMQIKRQIAVLSAILLIYIWILVREAFHEDLSNIKINKIMDQQH